MMVDEWSSAADVFDGVEAATFYAVRNGVEIVASTSRALKRRARQNGAEQTARFLSDPLRVVWHWPASDMIAVTPSPGDQLRDAAENLFVVQAVALQSLGNRWRLECASQR